MLRKYYFIIAILIFPCTIYAQGETNNWYFGQGAGIKFENNGTVTALTDGKLDTFEGCSTISDSFGNLLFYTDGINVFNKNHDVMVNGNNLYGDPSSTQSAIIIPKPDNKDILFIFTVDTSAFEGDPNLGFNYSIVDMTQDNGNGAVIEKNINLLDYCSEKITAVVKDCFEESIWVMAFSSENANSEEPLDTYYAFEVNKDGVQNNPVKSSFDIALEDPRGYIKFNADGTKLASANFFDGLFLYDFNKDTGQVFNQQNIAIAAINKFPYGIEFSPNQQFLYVQASNNAPANQVGVHSSSLIQFDLLDNNIENSQIIIDERPIYRGALQLGVNGKIYRTITERFSEGTPFLGVIESPNEKGQAANYIHNAISLNGKTGTQGLPPFIQSFFDKIPLIQNTEGSTSNSLALCEGEAFTLETENILGATYHWQRDGITINNFGPILTIENASQEDSGLYRLEITLQDSMACPIVGEAIIVVNELPETPNLVLTQCDLDSNSSDGITAFNLEQIIDGPEEHFFYQSIEDLEANIQIQPSIGYINTVPFNETIVYRKVNEFGCDSFGEISLEVVSISEDSNILKSLFACDQDPDEAVLNANFDLFDAFDLNTLNNFDISFYDNRTDAALETNPIASDYFGEERTVFARIENDNQCDSVVEISLSVNPTPSIDFPEQVLFCTDGPPLVVSAAPGFDFYRWSTSDGNGQTSNSQEFIISETGFYELEVGYIFNQNNEVVMCTTTTEFEVIPSNRAIISDILIQDLTDNNRVEILVSGDGDYEFSLDDIVYQDANIFNDIAPGIFTVFVRDKNNCGISEEIISVVGFPKFFTPNGDDINDTWQIKGISNEFQFNTTVSIFSRFGNLITQFGTASEGWDGTNNNNQLPESDYWFSVTLEDGRIFKGHFTLKR